MLARTASSVGCVEAGGWVSLVREAPVQVGVYAAKTHLSRLLDRAARGEEVVITRNGKPIARLVPVQRRRGPRKLGALRGKVRVAADFDAPLPKETLALFEGVR
ncbi:MAG: type II toxin-antitoxin system Phd/YefM family antitoxin [Deltaproteobacteria bacterium]|nr:MAG: type II toxin-antitoxin system Phd/YefM family antitoxin [Deltaproteobacteria bacterium]